MAPEIILAIFAFILGSVFASFFGVICYRVPANMSIVRPNSHCGACGHVLKWYENIPILSYIFLGGKCKNCGAKIGASSLVFEIIGGVSCLLAILKYGISFDSLFVFSIVLVLLLIAMYDYYTNTILDVSWIILAVLSVGYYLYKVFVLKEAFEIGLIGLGAVTLFFLLIKLIFSLILHQDALGTGDVIVMGIAGLFLGYKIILIAVLFASVIGAIIELTLIALKVKDREKEIPFCPYLCFGIYIALLYGADLVNFVMEAI